LDDNQEESKDTYDEKRKEVEEVANPIISKAYGGAPPSTEGPSGSPDEEGGEGESAPTVEEVD
jgi:heat shock 70kDa protein 1/2/6/8